MAISQPIRNTGTGKPVKANVPVRLNRKPSQAGVQNSSASSFREFTALKTQRNSASPDGLGRRAGRVPRRLQTGSKIDLEI